MKSYQLTHYEGEYLGPIDWNYDFHQHAWSEHRGGINPELISEMIGRLRALESGDWEATTDGGWPRVGWKKVLRVGMYDGWPHWEPIPSVCIAGTLGAEWHQFYSISDIMKATSK